MLFIVFFYNYPICKQSVSQVLIVSVKNDMKKLNTIRNKKVIGD